jgi:hypothetical protein
MSYIDAVSVISSPVLGNVWRAEDGGVHATVRLSGATLFFDSAQDARDVAAACAKAAEAHDRLAAEGAETGNEADNA